LSFVYLTNFKLLDFTVTKILLFLTLTVHSCVSLLQVWEVVAKFDSKLLIEHGPIFFMILYGIASVIMSLTVGEKLKNLLQNDFRQLLALKRVSPKLREKIKYESNKFTILTLINQILLVLTTFLYLPILEMDDNFYYAVAFFKKHFSSQMSSILSMIYYWTLPWLFACMTGGSFGISYIILHEKFLVYIINDLLKHISNGYTFDNDETLIRDRTYQSEIRKRLIISIKHHQVLTRYLLSWAIFNNLNDFEF
jgi:succinate dehydrogenase hydrophobic anchor subunit